MKKLIGIHAKARSGKDTCANHLWAVHEFTRIAFADPLKLAAQQMFGLTERQTWDDTVKEVDVPYWGMSPRRMFQLLGTDAAKPVFGDDVWVKRWMMAYDVLKDTDHVVVPDVRSELEAAHLRNRGGVILHLTRPGVEPVAAHSSENGIAFAEGDFYIVNDGTIEQLHADLDELITRLDGKQ